MLAFIIYLRYYLRIGLYRKENHIFFFFLLVFDKRNIREHVQFQQALGPANGVDVVLF